MILRQPPSRVPLFLPEPIKRRASLSGPKSGRFSRGSRTNERSIERSRKKKEASRRRESRVERKRSQRSRPASLSLWRKEELLVKNCRSRGTSREGSRFFRWLGRVTSSGDPRDHCLRSLPPQSASNGCPRSRISRASSRSADVFEDSSRSNNRRMTDKLEGREGREWFVIIGREIERKDLKIRSSPPPFENNVIILISRLFEMEISSKVFSEF